MTSELSKLLHEIKKCRDRDYSFEELCQTISSHSMDSFGSGRLSDEERPDRTNGTLTRVFKVPICYNTTHSSARGISECNMTFVTPCPTRTFRYKKTLNRLVITLVVQTRAASAWLMPLSKITGFISVCSCKGHFFFSLSPARRSDVQQDAAVISFSVCLSFSLSHTYTHTLMNL